METLYGPQTALTVENMSFSGHCLGDYPNYVRAMAKVKMACARANVNAALLDEATGAAIEQACHQLIAAPDPGQFPVDVYHGGGGIGLNMNISEVIASLAGAGIDPIEQVNLCQSTADVCHTALRLCLLEVFQNLESGLSELISVTAAKATAFNDYQTVARTCFQDGLGVSAGALFAATASAMKRILAEIDRMKTEFLLVNLGGTVIGSGSGASPYYRAAVIEELREVTGLQFRPHPSFYDAAAYPDDLVRASSLLTTLAGACQKYAQDLRILSSGPECGFGELVLPAVQAGSSFFPGKVNPVIPEMMIQCAILVNANHHAVNSCYEHGEIHLNSFEPMMGFLVIRSAEMLSSAITSFAGRCVAGIELDIEHCANYASTAIPLLAKAKDTLGYRQLSAIVNEKGVDAAADTVRQQLEAIAASAPTTERTTQ